MYKTLLVDDEPKILNGLLELVRWEDFGIEIVEYVMSAEHAMVVLEKNVVHLLITDIKMPEMNGLDLIRHAKKKYPHLKYIILSGYDDFNLVKEAAILGIENYLLKPVIQDELSETLLSVVQKLEKDQLEQIQLRSDTMILRNNVLNRWLMDRINQSELQHRLQLMQIHLQEQDLLIVLLKMIFLAEDHLSHQHLLIYAAENICNETIDHTNQFITVTDTHGYIAILFYGGGQYVDPVNIERVLAPCKSNIQKFLKRDVFITIGSIEQLFQNIPKSYHHALRLMDYSFMMPMNSVLNHTNFINTHDREDETWIPSLEQIRTLIHEKNKEGVEALIHEVFKKLKDGPVLSISQIHDLSLEVLYYILYTLQEHKLYSKFIKNQEKSLLIQIQQMKNIDEFSLWLKDLAVKVMDYLEDKDDSAHPIIQRIIAYVDTHLTDNLSLKSLSHDLNINPAYLGQLFIKEQGETFSTYLNQKRIELAKSMLTQTSLDINEISYKIGYVNVSYFSQLFKKSVGVYPKKYRIQNRMEHVVNRSDSI